MLSIKVKGDFTGIQKKLEAANKEFETKNFLLKVGQLINASIQQRVQRSGVGTDGQKMSPYSKAYADFRTTKKRNTDIRDLTFTGKMWQSLTAKNSTEGVRLYFGSANNANKARGNEARTPFFGLGTLENAIIKRELAKLTQNIVS